jgi:hypothetical protein
MTQRSLEFTERVTRARGEGRAELISCIRAADGWRADLALLANPFGGAGDGTKNGEVLEPEVDPIGVGIPSSNAGGATCLYPIAGPTILVPELSCALEGTRRPCL